MQERTRCRVRCKDGFKKLKKKNLKKMHSIVQTWNLWNLAERTITKPLATTYAGWLYYISDGQRSALEPLLCPQTSSLVTSSYLPPSLPPLA